MKLFKFLTNKKDIQEMYEIYQTVQNLKAYAISKYKNGWEDALDESFFHILENFDSSKGELENYAIKVVRTIFLSKNKNEIANDEQTKLGLDLKAAEEYNANAFTLQLEEKSKDEEECIKEMSSLYIKDLKFFVTGATKDRLEDYSRLFENYSLEVISKARNYLTEKYLKEAEDFIEFAKGSRIRSFTENRYEKSLDEGVEYLGELNGIVIVKRKQGSHVKKIFRLSVDGAVDMFLKLFYLNDGDFCFNMEGQVCYLTFAGKFVNNLEDLRASLENDLIGSILSRTPLKVFHYERGYEILLSSTRDTQHDLMLNLFGRAVAISFDRVVVKEIRDKIV